VLDVIGPGAASLVWAELSKESKRQIGVLIENPTYLSGRQNLLVAADEGRRPRGGGAELVDLDKGPGLEGYSSVAQQRSARLRPPLGNPAGATNPPTGLIRRIAERRNSYSAGNHPVARPAG